MSNCDHCIYSIDTVCRFGLIANAKGCCFILSTESNYIFQAYSRVVINDVISKLDKPIDLLSLLDLCATEKLDNNSTTALKYDTVKLRWDLLPIGPVEDVIKVLMYGAKKYGERNWENKIDDYRNRYYNAVMRHLTSWYRGECLDSESGLSHIAHAMCTLMFIDFFENHELQPAK